MEKDHSTPKKPKKLKSQLFRLFRNKKFFFLLFFVLSLFFSCSQIEEIEEKQFHQLQQRGEYIYRIHHEHQFTILSPEKNIVDVYPWQKDLKGNHPIITKEYFRCNGSSLNPVRIVKKNHVIEHYFDCGGFEKHSLPLQDGKEFVYPILLEILNHIQIKTEKKVVITSGHRCPEHHLYSDPSPENQYSKHMIGAEVSFYVQGMEAEPEKIVQVIQQFYKENPRYQGKKEYEEFKRYEKSDTNVSTQPWMNKEIFIKRFKKDEGRNFDNRHPYPYISIQVRYDRDRNEKVFYTWDKAYRQYLRK